jgi:hypothetical protein
MVNLHFHYREIEDADFTGVIVEIEQNGEIKRRYANFDERAVDGEIWGNHRETFQLREFEEAEAFVLSSGRYHLTRSSV